MRVTDSGTNMGWVPMVPMNREDSSDGKCQQWGQLKYSVGCISDFLKSLSKAYGNSLEYLYQARSWFNVCRKVRMDAPTVPIYR